jgi:uncharacterized protein YdaU (DUF1376 family)
MAMDPDYVPDFSSCTLPYVQWYQDDFVGGVRGMRAHEIGIYTMLLMEMYARGTAIDLPTERLARMCGADKRAFEKALQMLIDDGKIVRLDCGLWNERVENAFMSRAKMQQQQISAGEASARKRKEINEAAERALSERATGEQPSSEAQTIEKKEGTNVPLSETKISDLSKPIKAKKYPPGFEAAWAAYPRDQNMSKAEALPEWKKLSPEDQALVLPSIPAFKAYCKSNPDYRTIHFCRYLKLRRFEGFAGGDGPTIVSVDDWQKRLKYAREKRSWSSREWGPAPGAQDCRVPKEMLQDGDGDGWTEWVRAG